MDAKNFEMYLDGHKEFWIQEHGEDLIDISTKRYSYNCILYRNGWPFFAY